MKSNRETVRLLSYVTGAAPAPVGEHGVPAFIVPKDLLEALLVCAAHHDSMQVEAFIRGLLAAGPTYDGQVVREYT